MADMVERVAREIAGEMGYDYDDPAVSKFKGTFLRTARASLDVICEKIAAVALDRGDAELGEIIISALREPNEEEKRSGE